MKDAADQDHSLDEVWPQEGHEQRHDRAAAVARDICWPADHPLNERNHVLRHQLIGDRPIDIGVLPCSRRSGVYTRNRADRASRLGAHARASAPPGCINTCGGPSPNLLYHVDTAPGWRYSGISGRA